MYVAETSEGSVQLELKRDGSYLEVITIGTMNSGTTIRNEGAWTFWKDDDRVNLEDALIPYEDFRMLRRDFPKMGWSLAATRWWGTIELCGSVNNSIYFHRQQSH